MLWQADYGLRHKWMWFKVYSRGHEKTLEHCAWREDEPSRGTGQAGRVKDKVDICKATKLIEPSRVLNVTRHSARPGRQEAHFDLLDEDRWKALAHALDWDVDITQAKVRQPDCKSKDLPFGRHVWEAEGFADRAGWEMFADHNSTDREYMRFLRTFTAALVLFGQQRLNDKTGWK
jgi:hypothetical protein